LNISSNSVLYNTSLVTTLYINNNSIFNKNITMNNTLNISQNTNIYGNTSILSSINISNKSIFTNDVVNQNNMNILITIHICSYKLYIAWDRGRNYLFLGTLLCNFEPNLTRLCKHFS
jgi:hypothetical protein